jgi:hypothetical protein
VAANDTSASAAPSESDGWLADDKLFSTRPPISSHRMPRRLSRPIILAALVVITAAAGWTWLNGWGRSLPSNIVVAPAPAAAAPVLDSATRAARATATPSVPATAATTRSRSAVSPGPAVTSTVTMNVTVPPARSGPVSRPKPTRAAPAPTRSAASTVVTSPAAGMVVRVVNQASGESMSVARNATTDGAAIVQSTATGAGQRWRLVRSGSCFQLVNAHSTEALDDPDGSLDDGTQMQQWSYAQGNVNQTWCFTSVGAGLFSLQNQTSHSLLDLRNGPTGGGAIQQWGAEAYAPDANQTWRLIAAG